MHQKQIFMISQMIFNLLLLVYEKDTKTNSLYSEREKHLEKLTEGRGGKQRKGKEPTLNNTEVEH